MSKTTFPRSVVAIGVLLMLSLLIILTTILPII